MKWLKKLWLKIWNRIRGLFMAKGKMEIDETIYRWFQNAKTELSGGKTYYEQYELDIDSLCLGVVVLVENYAQSVLLLLNKDKILPAKALLRVMSDIFIKCKWCLKGLEESEKEFNNRFDKWRRYSLSQDKKRMESEIGILKEHYDDINTELVGKLEGFVEILEKEGITNSEKLPSMWEMRGVWESQSNMNFDALYRRFHQGIHPDWMLLQLLQRTNGQKIYYKADIEESTHDLKKYCLIIVGYLLEAIYSVNKLDFSRFEKDIKEIRGLTDKQ